MRVFLTGATGFIGSRIVAELIAAGHRVLSFTRSDAGARWLAQAGPEAHRGDLEDPDSLARGASQADAVIHTAFDHDFSKFIANCEKDRRVIQAIGAALVGSQRPFIITSGTGMGSPGPGQPAIEGVLDRDNANPRKLTAAEVAESGVSIATVRLPQVHDTAKQGLVTPLIEIAREKGVSAYVGNSANRWPAAHIADVVRLYCLALEKHQPGARWHAVAEEGVPMREIAETISTRLGVPVVSLSPDEAEHFGWLGAFAAMDMPASSAWMCRQLGWKPIGPGLIEDLRNVDYGSSEGSATGHV